MDADSSECPDLTIENDNEVISAIEQQADFKLIVPLVNGGLKANCISFRVESYAPTTFLQITLFDAQKRLILPLSCVQSLTRKRGYWMPSVKVRDNEPFDLALRRFKRACEKAGVLSEARRREYYEKPTTVRKRKNAAAVKRHLKKLQREARRFERLH